MKKKIVISVVFILLAQIIFAELNNPQELAFVEAFVQSDLPAMEQILKENQNQMDLSALLYTVIYGFNSLNTNKRLVVDIIQMFTRTRVNFNKKPSYNYYRSYLGDIESRDVQKFDGYPLEIAIDRNLGVQAIKVLLESGADMYLAEGFIFPLSDEQIAIAKLFIENGYNVNRIQRTYEVVLQIAARRGSFGIVKLLIESGAMVNWRHNNYHKTAAEQAYDGGYIDIYNYLKQNGAVWSPPNQVASTQPSQQSRSTYNDDYSPPPSSSSSNSSSSSSSASSRNTARDVVDTIQRAFEAPIENGRYRVSGRTEEITFAGIAKSGNVSFKDSSGTTHRGTYSIDGNRLTINVMSRSFFYDVTSETSFSGNGESWFRVGF
ncbi:MAG: ankyrin repeat domain-containing protein [Treponema sp.]|nr:ankyrin repeat domain-containing protein [Treponema sp.]